MIIEDLTDARILVKLRRHLNYAEAARALKLPATTLSRRVMEMEKRAGLLFFQRSTRAVNITDAGELAAIHAERMLVEADAVESSIEGLRGAAVGTVRLTTPVIFGQALLGPLSGAFIERFPACSLAVEVTDRQLDLIPDNYDVAIRVGPVVDEAMKARLLGRGRARLYRRKRGNYDTVSLPAHPQELADHRLALLHWGPNPKSSLSLTSAETAEVYSFNVEPKLICLNPWLLLAATLASDVIATLPDIVAKQPFAAGELEIVLPNWFARQAPINIVFPSGRLMRPAVRAFIDLAVEMIPPVLN
ncbi:MAG: LysR family transcriptional regulator [Chitinophagales bacterium]|nr:LysR family transcriptional regulator [Hyphomicrobiales bacterium]